MFKIVNLTAAAAFALAVGFGGTAQGKEGFPFDGDLVGYWHFDKNSAAADAVNDGSTTTVAVMNGDATRSTDVPDLPSNLNSVVLDGTGDFVSVAHTAGLDVTSPYTLSTWVKVDSASGHRPILFRGATNANDIEVYVQNSTNNLIVAHNRGNGGTFDFVGFADPPNGSYFHLAVTFDGSDVKAFYDGAAAGVTQNTTAMGSPDDTTKGWLMGKVDHTAFGGTLFFTGNMDEVRIYDVALTGTQIATMFASLCDFTIDSTASIQDTIDAASLVAGKNVCLTDDVADFEDREVIFESEHSGITLRAANGNEIPVLDGSGLSASGSHFAISFDSDDDALVEDVEIRGLTIQNYAGSGTGSDRSSAIQAFGTTPTEGIRIRESTMTGFVWNGVLVGSEGDVIHKAWMVHSNTVSDVGFVGIELTNCTSCSILHNDVVTDSPSAGRSGILIQVRNTIPESGEVHINGVNVLHNTVDSAGATGIEVLVFAGNISTFQPIDGATSLLTTMVVNNNTLIDNGSFGIRYRTFNEAATLVGGNIKHNVIDCDTGDAPVVGIQVSESGFDGPGTISGVKLRRNKIDSDCVPKVDKPSGTL